MLKNVSLIGTPSTELWSSKVLTSGPFLRNPRINKASEGLFLTQGLLTNQLTTT